MLIDGMKAIAGLLLLAPTLAAAESPTAVGLWRTIDDKTKVERSLVRVTEQGGVYQGTVEKILTTLPDDDPQHRCTKCLGDRKDKPVVGMTIVWGMRRDGNTYSGGEVLDPKNGKIYSAKMTLADDGRTLDVRGFIGVSLLGRTQTWTRVE